ncbi:short-chain dehydrogenase [Xylaria acuta]|nr:short-chain dehydrogenase [Xylaria acuta]
MSGTLKHMCNREVLLTEENLETQEGKVFIVTEANTGLGKELTKILYSKHAKVYVAARSDAKANAAIDDIRHLYPDSKGDLVYLHLNLNDLTTIKTSADTFLTKEKRLDVLFNNAGVMVPPQGSTTAQGYELQLGVNSIATFLFTRFLYPIMVSNAATGAPKPAIDFDDMDYKKDEGAWTKYQRSKAGTILHACEAARRSQRNGEGVLHVALHPGVFPTDLQQTMPGWQSRLVKMLGKESKYGGYTQLFAGLHPSAQNGAFVAPYGTLDKARKDLTDEALRRQYWEWTEKQIEPCVQKL